MLTRQRPFLTFGLPFLTFMVLGHQALAYIGQGRYDVRDGYEKQRELLVKRDQVSLPKESILTPPEADNYDIVRIPRPDDSRS